MIDHCDKRLTEATFKKYHEYIKNMKCFPPDFWGLPRVHHSLVEICEKNQLENTVVAFFNHDAVLQMRALIEECGLRGFTVGGAQISEKHCGFVINRGGATCADVVALTEQVSRIVRDKTGFVLEREIRVVR